MQNVSGKRVIVTGGSQGLGLAMVQAFVDGGAQVTAIGRNEARLAAAERAGAAVIVGDATDEVFISQTLSKEMPDVLILNAGSRLPMKSIEEQSWEEFSRIWNTDVKAGLVGIQAALRAPLKHGSRVLVMSSGAAMVLAVPFIRPEGLRLSGGYVGAKRMLWFMAHCANTVSQERNLGIHFQVLVPGQVIPGTILGHQVAAAYAAIENVTVEEHVVKRYGSIMEPQEFAGRIVDLIRDPNYSGGVAYGVRAGSGITPLDI